MCKLAEYVAAAMPTYNNGIYDVKLKNFVLLGTINAAHNYNIAIIDDGGQYMVQTHGLSTNMDQDDKFLI